MQLKQGECCSYVNIGTAPVSLDVLFQDLWHIVISP